jgi:hypothetical protein
MEPTSGTDPVVERFDFAVLSQGGEAKVADVGEVDDVVGGLVGEDEVRRWRGARVAELVRDRLVGGPMHDVARQQGNALFHAPVDLAQNQPLAARDDESFGEYAIFELGAVLAWR